MYPRVDDARLPLECWHSALHVVWCVQGEDRLQGLVPIVYELGLCTGFLWALHYL